MYYPFPKLAALALLAGLWIQQGAQAGYIPLTLNKPYTQNFNSLNKAPEDKDYPWVNEANDPKIKATIEGWYSSRSTYRVSDGSNFNPALYSFGSANAADRALGALTGGLDPNKSIYFGATFENQTGKIITDLLVEYAGEQWRAGTTDGQTLLFTIRSNPFAKEGEHIAQLDFASLQNPGTSARLDGNAAANRKAISFTIKNLDIVPNQLVDLQWTLNHPTKGLSHGLAIDDLQVSVAGTKDPPPMPEAVPEPSSLTLLGVGTLVLLGRRWLRKRGSSC